MTIQQVQTRGIYHGLPVFPEHQKGLTAIITGANDIRLYAQSAGSGTRALDQDLLSV